jgi:hypothetical protein
MAAAPMRLIFSLPLQKLSRQMSAPNAWQLNRKTIGMLQRSFLWSAP